MTRLEALRQSADYIRGEFVSERAHACADALNELADDVEAGRVSLEPVVVHAVACRSIDCAYSTQPAKPALPPPPSWLQHGV